MNLKTLNTYCWGATAFLVLGSTIYLNVEAYKLGKKFEQIPDIRPASEYLTEVNMSLEEANRISLEIQDNSKKLHDSMVVITESLRESTRSFKDLSNSLEEGTKTANDITTVFNNFSDECEKNNSENKAGSK